jgi:hypothetical protein
MANQSVAKIREIEPTGPLAVILLQKIEPKAAGISPRASLKMTKYQHVTKNHEIEPKALREGLPSTTVCAK